MMRLLLVISLLIAGHSKAIDTAAKFAYLVDYQTGYIYLDKDAGAKIYPSSMTKMMTAYIVFEAIKKGYISLDTEFTVSRTAYKKGGSRSFVKLKSQISVDTLLKGMIVQSGNDATIVLAEGLAGTEAEFAVQMNDMAAKLGMSNTHFTNATGWPDENHYSTAFDLVNLGRHLIKDHPEFYGYYSQQQFTHNKITQQNRNLLLGKYDGADGIKTGYTKAAGYGIISTAKRDNRRIISLVNGANSKKARISESRKLLDYAFNNFKNATIIARATPIIEAPVIFGDVEKISLIAKEDIIQTVHKTTKSGQKITIRVEYKSPLIAPISKDTQIGMAIIMRGDVAIDEVELYPSRAVAKIGYWGKLLDYPSYLWSRMMAD